MFEFPSDGKIIYRCPMSPILFCTHIQVCIFIYVHSRPNTFEVLFSNMKISLFWPFSFVGNFSLLCILCAFSLLKLLPCPHLLPAPFSHLISIPHLLHSGFPELNVASHLVHLIASVFRFLSPFKLLPSPSST